MLKWIGGCLVLIVIVVIAGGSYGYRKLNAIAAEPPPSVVILSPAKRVFASLANGDSLRTWRLEGAGVTSTRRGALMVDDTIQVQPGRSGEDNTRRVTWVVDSIAPDRLLVLAMRRDGLTVGSRRDSLVAMGDSTRVVVTFATGSQMPDVARKMFIGGMRMSAGLELSRLKSRVEGTASATGSPAPPQR